MNRCKHTGRKHRMREAQVDEALKAIEQPPVITDHAIIKWLPTQAQINEAHRAADYDTRTI